MAVYYNEWEAYPAQWLRNLIKAGHLPEGDVDTRDIREVQPDDLKGYAQCHFFAGIGGWPLALRMAGWPDDRPVWTGSCPCQPFSSAGKRSAQSDERHLWPDWFRLIRECCPAILFGEQVADAVAAGWWDDATHDLENEGYAVASAVLPACSVDAPHKRDRLWLVAVPKHQRRNAGKIGDRLTAGDEDRRVQQSQGLCCSPVSMAHASSVGLEEQRIPAEGVKLVAHPGGSDGSRENTNISRHWATEPGMGRVANGVPARVEQLRAYGNAIVPQVAAEFIKAVDYAIHPTGGTR